MKKLIAIILSALLLVPAVPVWAEYDYSAMTEELSELIERCKALGIQTDYEAVNLNVIRRFEKYMNGDEDAGVSADILSYNNSQITRLYNEAKNNLNGYIGGTKYPLSASRAKMSGLAKNGSQLLSGRKSVYSVGYGHFSPAQYDVPVFQDFGANNIQIEIGPTYLRNEEAHWTESSRGNPNVTVKTSAYQGKSSKPSLYVKNKTEEVKNVYYTFSQTVSCKPNTKYKFGCYSKISSMGNNTNYVSVNGIEAAGRKLFSTSNGWVDTGSVYTTEADREQLQFTIAVSGTITAYFDDCYLYELNSAGEVVGENLLKNPGFDEGRSYANSAGFIIDTLEAAEKSNVAVNLLLSPHYFPENIDADIYNSKASGFLKYNINATEAKEVLENYLRTLLPNLTGYKALASIILANEPVFKTTDYPEFYNPLFREYLKDVHGSISALNSAYGSDYSDFSEISMPSDVTAYDALSYDWIEFNDKTLADWHAWLAGIVREYLPNVPISTKMMGIIEGSGGDIPDRMYLTRGTDIDLLGAVTDWAGNDSYDMISSPETYYRTMFLYDYQSSAVGKPVYNSEDHLTADGDSEFSEEQYKHWGNSLWQGAVHGRSMSTLWIWGRTRDKSSAIYNSALTRPDVIAETGKRALDLGRLSEEVRAVGKTGEVALWYSKPSRLYDASYSTYMMNTYKALLNIGKQPGIVSDKSLATLSNYKVLIIPCAKYCTPEALAAVKAFAENGGKVVYSGNAFSKNQYKNAQDNSIITSKGYSYAAGNGVSAIAAELADYLSEFGLLRVTLKTASGKIPENVDWSYSIDGERLLVNVSNLDYDSVQSVDVYLDGEKVSGMRDMITDTKISGSVALEGYTPVLLEKTFAPVKNSIKSVSESSGRILWSYAKDGSETANVYKLLKNGMPEFLETVSGYGYTYSENGTYLIKASSTGYEEESGIMITAGDADAFGVELSSASAEGNSVMCDIKLSNKLSYLATCVLEVKIKNAEGDVIDCASCKPIIGAEESRGVKMTLAGSEEPYKIEVVALDAYGGKAVSNLAEKIFEE